MQRITVTKAVTVNNRLTLLRLQEQSNSALAYTLTLESTPSVRRISATEAVKSKSDTQPPSAKAVSIVLPSSAAPPGRRPVTQTLEIPACSPNAHEMLVLTIASQ